MAVPSLSYCTAKALSGCHQSCGVVTELSPSWGALGQQQSSSAVEALLHTSCGSTQSEPRMGHAGYWGLTLGRAILRLTKSMSADLIEEGQGTQRCP